MPQNPDSDNKQLFSLVELLPVGSSVNMKNEHPEDRAVRLEIVKEEARYRHQRDNVRFYGFSAMFLMTFCVTGWVSVTTTDQSMAAWARNIVSGLVSGIFGYIIGSSSKYSKAE